jgi:hypothetical protein
VIFLTLLKTSRIRQYGYSVLMELTSLEEPPLLDDVGSCWYPPTAGPSRHLRHLQQTHLSTITQSIINHKTNCALLDAR